MRSSRPNRRERRASRFSRTSLSSSGHLAGGMLAFGALTSAFHSDSAMAEVVVSAPNAPRSSQSNIAPRVSILQPSYADIIKGTTQIVIAVETKGAPTKNVEMFIDGVSATGGAAALAGLNSAQFDWKTTTVKDGLRRLTVRVTDENGLRGEAETQVYINNSRTSDKTAPTLNWQNVRDGELLHGETKLQLGASDNFGVKYIVITVNPIDQPDRTPALRASLINRAPFEYSLDTTRLPDGVYVLNARAYDMLENEGSTQRVTFGVTNNGMNPTVIEQLNEVLAAQKPATSSTRSSAITTNARPKMQPKTNVRASTVITTVKPQTVKPQTVVAPKTTTPKVQIAKPVAKPNAVKSAPVRIAAATIKTLSAKSQTPSIAVSRPVIERPILTQAANAQALSSAAVVKNAPLAGSNQTEIPTKIGRVAEKLRVAGKPRLAAVPKTTQKPHISLETASNETFAATVAESEKPVDVFASTVAPQDFSATTSRSDVVTQRAQTPQAPIRLAKLPQTRAMQTPESVATSAITTSQNVDARIEITTSKVVSETPQSIEYSMSPRAALPTIAPRKTARSFGSLVRTVVAPEIENATVSTLAPQLTTVAVKNASLALANEKVLPQVGMSSLRSTPKLSAPVLASRPLPKNAPTLRVAELPKLRAPKANVSATITPTVATANVVESRVEVAVSETKSVVPQRAQTPQRLAALPTRRDDATTSETFAAPLSAKVRHNAAITVSPLTIAAMQARGSQAFVPASHVVKKGETLSLLAARYGLRTKTLASVNGLKTAGILSVGQKLSLPRALKVSYRGHDGSGDVQGVERTDTVLADQLQSLCLGRGLVR